MLLKSFCNNLKKLSRKFKNGQKTYYKLHFYIEKLHEITYKREYNNIVNSCNFLLSKLEEMKSCIYCIKAANTWVRLQWIWHHLFILVLEENVPFTTKIVCKKQFLTIVCNHDAMFKLHIAGLRVDNSKSAIIESWNIV